METFIGVLIGGTIVGGIWLLVNQQKRSGQRFMNERVGHPYPVHPITGETPTYFPDIAPGMGHVSLSRLNRAMQEVDKGLYKTAIVGVGGGGGGSAKKPRKPRIVK